MYGCTIRQMLFEISVIKKVLTKIVDNLYSGNSNMVTLLELATIIIKVSELNLTGV